ncbi:MAG: HAMP domain-containing protein, partial [Rhodospirillaceae bacterium]
MRIQTKLLILLLVIALLPLVALSLRGQRATENLGSAIADQDRALMSGEIETRLQQSIAYSSDILSTQQRQVELALRLQAAEIERRLEGPLPQDEVPLYSDHDFDTPATWPPGTELALDHVLSGTGPEMKAVPISRVHQAFHIAGPGHDSQDVSPEMQLEMRRLASMDAVYRRLSDTAPGLFYWQYVSLRDGLHAVFPGHGGYPEGFDPRARNWYVTAAAKGELTWTPPTLDAATRRVLLTASMPVYAADGQIAGVTGIDVDILSRLTDIQSRLHLGANAASYIVRVAGADGGPPTSDSRPALRVVATSSYTDTGTAWDAQIDEPVLASGAPAGMDGMIQDLRAGHGGLRHMPRDGADAVWVYGPIESLGAALLYIVPAQNVAAIADQTRNSVWDVTTRQMRLAGIASVGLMVIVAVISIFAARSITEPLRQLAHVAKGLAAGRLDTRARVVSHDEVGELAAAFNAMVPELQSHIKVKEGLAVAREVQQKLLPAAPPVIPGYDVAGLSLYSEDVGGDYYDFLEMTDRAGARRVGVVVGDVAGHGVVAALTMTAVRVLLRSYAGDGAQLLPAMQAVNHHLAVDAAAGRFVTLVYMVIDPIAPHRQLRWISAGQGPLLFYDMVNYRFEELAAQDIPLGVERDWNFHETTRSDWPRQGLLMIGTD